MLLPSLPAEIPGMAERIIWTDCFDQIEAPSPKGENELHALKLDWNRFVTDRTIDFIKGEVAAIREGGSELPVTANLMYDYNGHD